MKKTFIPIVAILCLLFAIALVACQGTCQHAYDYPCHTVCNLCGEERVVEDGQLEHTFEDDGNCTTTVTCDHCDTLIVQANSHDYTGLLQKDETAHWLACQNDGCLVKSNLQGHSKGADGKCTVCEYVIEPHDHAYTVAKNDADGHWTACLCGAVDPNNPKTQHDVEDDNNCETAEICSCGYTVTAATDHVAGADDGNCTTATTCQNCNFVFVQALAEHSVANYWNATNVEHFHICLNEGCQVKIDKAQHYGEDDGDCTTALLCDGCDWVLKDATDGHSPVIVANDDETHSAICENCDAVDQPELHDNAYFVGGACTVCGAQHECDYSGNNYCICYFCGQQKHLLDSQCVCERCPIVLHVVDPTTGICSQCNTFAAAASITMNNQKTYYSSFDDALIFADGKNGIEIVLENNCYVMEPMFDLSGGSLTIDLNGKSLGAMTNYVLRPEGGNITIKDSVGGGSTAESIGALGGYITIEGGIHNYVIGKNITIEDGYFRKIVINQAGFVVFGGSFELVTLHKNQGTIDVILADGYCFYDQNGNVVDTANLQTDEYGWYTLQNVTVGKTK